MMKKCSYGCENNGIYFFEKINKWCCSKHRNSCPEIIKKMNKNKIGRKKSPMSDDQKKKIGNSNRGKKRTFTEDHKKNMSEAKKGKIFTDEHKNNISLSLKGILIGEKNGMFGKHHSDNSKQILSEKTKSWVEQNNGKPAFYGRSHTKESKEKMSASHKELFKDPNFVEDFKTRNLKHNISIPNKQEIKILNLLQEILPNKYIFCGDFSIWINGKNPDFINKNDKKIIEFFGKRWHKKTDEIERINHFKKEGYKTLIIWDFEIKNINNIKERILMFNNEKNDLCSSTSSKNEI